MWKQYPGLISRGFLDMNKNQKRKAKQRLESLLLDALNSGSATPLTEQD